MLFKHHFFRYDPTILWACLGKEFTCVIINYTNNSPEIKYLKSSDPKLKILIETIGPCQLSLREDYFTKLVSSIIGQQLSVKAAQTIWERVKSLCGGEITPQNILHMEDVFLDQREFLQLKPLTLKVCLRKCCKMKSIFVRYAVNQIMK